MFLIENRLPFGFMRKGAMPWLSTMSTNAGILIAAGLLIWGVGLMPFLVVHLPIILIGATAGVWLFYVQHQFEATTWDMATNWRQPEAALHGSSHYDLPSALCWFSGNIGVTARPRPGGTGSRPGGTVKATAGQRLIGNGFETTTVRAPDR